MQGYELRRLWSLHGALRCSEGFLEHRSPFSHRPLILAHPPSIRRQSSGQSAIAGAPARTVGEGVPGGAATALCIFLCV